MTWRTGCTGTARAHRALARAAAASVVILTVLPLALLTAACDSDTEPVEPDPQSICAGDDRVEVYAAGMEKPGDKGLLRVRLVASEPAPPQKGENTWTVQVTDAAGAPVEGATFAVTPRMPDHGHGSATTPAVTAGGAAGEYAIASLDLAMAGLWTVTLDITTAAGETDTVTFSFCVEG